MLILNSPHNPTGKVTHNLPVFDYFCTLKIIAWSHSCNLLHEGIYVERDGRHSANRARKPQPNSYLRRSVQIQRVQPTRAWRLQLHRALSLCQTSWHVRSHNNIIQLRKNVFLYWLASWLDSRTREIHQAYAGLTALCSILCLDSNTARTHFSLASSGTSI